jgi:hypothetical protein
MNRRKAVIWIGILLLFNFIVIIVNNPAPVKAEYFSTNVLVNDAWVNNSTQMYPSILVDNNDTIYVIWEDWRNDADGYYSWTPVYGGTDAAQNADIYVCNSTDGGFTFGADRRVNDDIGKVQQGKDWSYRALACGDDGSLHAVWTDWRNDADGMEGDEGGIDGVDNTDIYYANSSDKGNTWSVNKQINDDGGIAKQQSATIAIDSKGYIHIVWEDNRSGNFDIFYTNSTDDGITFSPNKRINDVSTGSRHPTIDIDLTTDNIYVVWGDYRDPATKPDIYFTRSTDGGLTFEANKKVNTRDAQEDVESFISVRDGLIGIAWGHYTGSDSGIYFSTSTDEGGNFSESVKVNDVPGAWGWPNIAIDSKKKISIVWEDKRNGNLDVYYANSTDYGLTFGTSQRVNDDTGSAGQRMQCIDVDGNDFLCIAWADSRRNEQPGTRDIYFARTLPAPSVPDYIPWESYPLFPINIGIGSPVKISTRIKNQGWQNVLNTSTIAFYNQTSPSSPFQEYSVPPLNISEITNETYIATWTAPTVPGTYHIIIEVDYYNNIVEELNKSNNMYIFEFNVYDVLPPTNLTTSIIGAYDVLLNWIPPPSSYIDHYLIYGNEDQRGFDFKSLIHNTSLNFDPQRTNWTDINGINRTKEYYYIVRAVITIGPSTFISSTSNTAGIWTKTFPVGISTFSLPLEPFIGKDTEFYCHDMDAPYIRWMNYTTHTWVQHNKNDFGNNTILKIGEGYEIGFDSETNYTFTGLPGAMISYDDDNGFLGFDSHSNSKNLTVIIDPGGNVTLIWEEPPDMNIGDWYEVYFSYNRDGFFGTFDKDYFIVSSPVYYGNNSAYHYGISAYNPGKRVFYMVIPYNKSGVRGASTYSIGIWTEEFLSEYDTFGIPLKLNYNETADWYCDNIPDTVGVNYFNEDNQRWYWHSKRMPGGAFDTEIVVGEGYQISTSNLTKYTFIGH